MFDALVRNNYLMNVHACRTYIVYKSLYVYRFKKRYAIRHYISINSDY